MAHILFSSCLVLLFRFQLFLMRESLFAAVFKTRMEAAMIIMICSMLAPGRYRAISCDISFMVC